MTGIYLILYAACLANYIRYKYYYMYLAINEMKNLALNMIYMGKKLKGLFFLIRNCRTVWTMSTVRWPPPLDMFNIRHYKKPIKSPFVQVQDKLCGNDVMNVLYKNTLFSYDWTKTWLPLAIDAFNCNL